MLFSNIFNSFKMLKTFPNFLLIDKVTINESRFGKLKNYLKNTKEVGYITELKTSKDIFVVPNDKESINKAVDLMAQLILTQYALSPIFVYNQTDLPLVIGNFPEGIPDRNFFKKKHLIPVKSFPGGIVLLRNEVH
jgi:hypothetical protein